MSEIAKLHKFDFSGVKSADEVEEDNVQNMPTDDDEMVSKDDDVDMPEADGMSDSGKVKEHHSTSHLCKLFCILLLSSSAKRRSRETLNCWRKNVIPLRTIAEYRKKGSCLSV